MTKIFYSFLFIFHFFDHNHSMRKRFFYFSYCGLPFANFICHFARYSARTLFSILAILLILTGCSRDVTLELDLEEIESSLSILERDPNFKIVYIDTDENFKELYFDSISESGSTFKLQTTKDRFTPVLVIFDVEPTENISKGGILYPLTTQADNASAFCAEIYIKLFLNSYEEKEDIRKFCSFFNWNRFYQKASSYENPFLLDEEKLCASIASGTFSERSFSLKTSSQ